MRGLLLAMVATGCASPALPPPRSRVTARAKAAHVAVPLEAHVEEETVAEEPFRRDRTPACCLDVVPKSYVEPAPFTPLPELSFDAVPAAVASVRDESCEHARAELGQAVSIAELRLLERLRGARVSLSDPLMPETERRFRLWGEYDEALDDFTRVYRSELKGPLVRAILDHPKVRVAIEFTVTRRWGPKLSPDLRASLVAVAGERALGADPEQFEQLATWCTTEAIASRKGRWLAVLNGAE